MAMARKGRRSITVDEILYHYMVTFERSERVTIRRGDDIGPCLFVFPFTIMKPSHVADAIRFALSRRWQTSHAPDDCWLVFNSDEDGRSCFEHISNDDFRVVTYSTRGRIPTSMDASQFEDTRPWYDRPKPTTRME